MSPSTSRTDALAAGQLALTRAAWQEARTHFEDALGEEPSGAAWEGLSWAAWWEGDEQATLAAREQAYRAYREAGETCAAARCATWLGSDLHDFRGDDVLAWVWLRRARAELEDRPPCREHGWLLLLESVMVRCERDPARTIAMTREAVELARALGDPGVEAVGLSMLGASLIDAGDAEEGVRRLDEAGALAVDDRAGELACGWALCHTVAGCAEVGEFHRAEQWARTLHSFSARWAARHFFGTCRTAYGGVLTRRGDWPSAEEELTSALEDLQASRKPMAGAPIVRLAELRLRQGRHDEARGLFEQALPGLQAIVGLGELALEEGDATSAVEAAERVLRRLGEASVLERFAALELLARARCAAGDAEGARAAAANVADAAARLGTPYMRARGALVLAEVHAGAGDHDGARQLAEDAIDLFGGCDAPFDAARARLVLARALEGLGRADSAGAERRAAEEALASLGVRAAAAPATSEELSPRELDVLRLVAGGLSDAQIAERLFLSPHTVHRHVANVRTKLRLPSRTAAVAYAARAGLL